MTFRLDRLDYMSNKAADDLVKTIVTKAQAEQEKLILSQLNEFISRGLIVIEKTQPVLVRCADQEGIEMRQSVRLVLKDQEYVEKLEKENAQLKQQLEDIKNALTK